MLSQLPLCVFFFLPSQREHQKLLFHESLFLFNKSAVPSTSSGELEQLDKRDPGLPVNDATSLDLRGVRGGSRCDKTRQILSASDGAFVRYNYFFILSIFLSYEL